MFPDDPECPLRPTLVAEVGGDQLAVVQEVVHILHLAGDPSKVGEDRGIASVSLDGSDSSYTPAPYATGIAALDGELFWAAFNPVTWVVTVQEGSKDGGPPVELYTTTGGATFVAAQADRLVIAIDRGFTPEQSLATGAVVSVPRGGEAALPLATHLTAPRPIVMNESHAFWSTHEREEGVGWVNSRVESIPLGGGAIQVVATGIFPYHLSVADAVYVSGCDLGKTGGKNCPEVDTWMILECPLTGCGSNNELGRVHAISGQITGMAADASGVYYLLEQQGSVPVAASLLKIPTGSTTPETIASGFPHAWELRINDEYLFFIGETDWRTTGLFRLAR